MNKFKKLLIIIFGVMLLTGCEFKYDESMYISEEGEITIDSLLTYDKEFINSMIYFDNMEDLEDLEDLDPSDTKVPEASKADIKKFLNEQKPDFADGSKVQIYEDDINGNYGYKITKNIADIETVSGKNAVTYILNDEERDENVQMFKKEGDTYIARFKFNYDNIMDEDIADGSEDFENSLSMIKIKSTFNINLPTKAISHNADTVADDGKILNWNLDAEKDNYIEFSFKLKDNTVIADTSDTPSSLLFMMIGGIVIIVIIIIVILVLFAVRNKKQNKNVEPISQTIPSAVPKSTVVVSPESNNLGGQVQNNNVQNIQSSVEPVQIQPLNVNQASPVAPINTVQNEPIQVNQVVPPVNAAPVNPVQTNPVNEQTVSPVVPVTPIEPIKETTVVPVTPVEPIKEVPVIKEAPQVESVKVTPIEVKSIPVQPVESVVNQNITTQTQSVQEPVNQIPKMNDSQIPNPNPVMESNSVSGSVINNNTNQIPSSVNDNQVVQNSVIENKEISNTQNVVKEDNIFDEVNMFDNIEPKAEPITPTVTVNEPIVLQNNESQPIIVEEPITPVVNSDINLNSQNKIDEINNSQVEEQTTNNSTVLPVIEASPVLEEPNISLPPEAPIKLENASSQSEPVEVVQENKFIQTDFTNKDGENL